MGLAGEEENDWYIDGSDDEKYNPTKLPRGTWQPDPKTILSMFEKLEKEKVLELKWKCPGRRSPESEKPDEDADDEDDDGMDIEEEEVKEEEEKKVPEHSEFDFDDFGSDASAKITPRRTPGSGRTPKSQKKKVACMDKVLDDIRRQQKERAAQKEARKGMSRSPASPGRFRLGMTGSPRSAGSPMGFMSHRPDIYSTPLRVPPTYSMQSVSSSTENTRSKEETSKPAGGSAGSQIPTTAIDTTVSAAAAALQIN